MRIAKRLVVILAFAMVGVSAWFALDTEGFLEVFGRDARVYAGIVAAGILGFGIVALRIFQGKVNSWDALLEGVGLSGVFAGYQIFVHGIPSWIAPGWCALATGLLCLFLRFLDPRRKS